MRAVNGVLPVAAEAAPAAPSAQKPTISAPPPLTNDLRRELLLVQEAGHGYFPPFAITAAAFWIAVRIRGYVPQRQRCPFIAVRI